MFDIAYVVAFLTLGWMAFAIYSALAAFIAVPRTDQSNWFASFVYWHGRITIVVAAIMAAILILKAFAVLISQLVLLS